jgi:hypothetical protein
MTTPDLDKNLARYDQHLDMLEAFVDAHSIKGVLQMLQSISYAKADHIRDSWQDLQLSRQWELVGHKIGSLADKLPWVIGASQ